MFLINSSFFSLNYNHALSGKSLQRPFEERERKDSKSSLVTHSHSVSSVFLLLELWIFEALLAKIMLQ